MRYSRKFLTARLALVASEMGWSVDGDYSTVGKVSLSYIACYGGHNVEQVTSTTGGMRNLNGNGRMSARELMHWYDGVLCGVREKR
jgi:hypothetical protein